ncbi:MAG: hypothetical protein ACPG4T_15840 [Nannocystaceae bacterium]
MSSSLLIGLGGVGVSLAITEPNFGAVGLLIGSLGSVAILLALGSLVWVLWHPNNYRERIQSGPGWLVLRRTPRTHKIIALACPVKVDDSTYNDLSMFLHFEVTTSLVLEGSDGRRVPIGVNQPAEERARLRAELERVVALANSSTTCPPAEWSYPMSLPLGRRLSDYGKLFYASLRKPRPFLLTDLVCIAGIFGLSRLILLPGLLTSYVIAITLFTIGLFLRRWDTSYMGTLAGFHYINLGLGYDSAGLIMGLTASLTFWVYFDTYLALAAGFVVLGVHVHLLRYARRTQPKQNPRSRRVELLSTILMLPLALVHEHLAFIYCADLAKEFFVLALPMLVPMIGLFYLPVRMHAFIDDPDNRSNYAWFWLTVFAMLLAGTIGWSPL